MAAIVGAGKECLVWAGLSLAVLLSGGSMAFAGEGAVRPTGPEQAVYVTPAAAPQLNKNFRARIVYQSGHVEDFLIVASATNAFDNMRERFLKVAAGASVPTGVHALADGATVAVRWMDVASFYTWQD